MDRASLAYPFLKALPPDVTVVTANRALARHLRDAHGRMQRATGKRVWASPDIVAFAPWVRRCFEELLEVSSRSEPALLGAHHERVLWQQVVAQAERERAEATLQLATAARRARSAWRLLAQWRYDLARYKGPLNVDGQQFASWVGMFEQRCRDGEWIDAAKVPDLLTRRARGGWRPRARAVFCVGLAQPTPQQSALFDALGKGLVTTLPSPSAGALARHKRVAFATRAEELEAAARWARALVEQARAPAPIGIVVPELRAFRSEVVRVFEDILTPAAALPGATSSAGPFSLSLGASLREQPLVKSALLILELASGEMAREDVGELLRSPFVAAAFAEFEARARLDAALRRSGERHIALAWLAAQLRNPAFAEAAPVLGQALAALSDAAARAPARHALSDWSAAFSDWLGIVGFPGTRPLCLAEQQALEAFRELLGELASLDSVLDRAAMPRALSLLAGLAGERVFEPPADRAPIEVLTLAEADGCAFSHLWVSGLHDGAWPAAPRPDPLLPIALQRALGMPHSSPALELAHAESLTARVLHGAGQAVVSYAEAHGEERVRVSPLVAHLPLCPADDVARAAVPTLAASLAGARPAFERLDDRRAPALAPREGVRGGAGLFADQAACPFRAFAIHRLGARDVSAATSGLDARARGTLVHRLMERLWRVLGSQAALRSMSHSERERSVRDAVAETLREEAPRKPRTLDGRLLELERERLVALALAALARDLERPDFEVLPPEAQSQAKIGDISVTIRPDRIDRLSAGGHLLIDYKTGLPEPKGWFGERPDEPQLPVYATAMARRAPRNDHGIDHGIDKGLEIVGVAFAVLRRGDVGYRGLAARGEIAPGLATLEQGRLRVAAGIGSWRELERHWAYVLEGLARQFADGAAQVDPKRYPATCRNCNLHLLCRVHERAVAAELES